MSAKARLPDRSPVTQRAEHCLDQKIRPRASCGIKCYALWVRASVFFSPLAAAIKNFIAMAIKFLIAINTVY